MRNLLNPKWLFIINTLPIVVLFFLFFSQFSIIKTLLDENSIRYWIIFGVSLGTLGLLNFLYALYLTLKKKSVNVWYGVLALLCYIGFIYLYIWHLDKIFPFSIPQWLLSGNIFLYVGTFLMPTLAYSLFILVSHFTPDDKEHKPWVNFLIAIGIPIVGYLFSRIGLPLWWYQVEGMFFTHALLILFISITLVFFFFLVRGVFIIATKKANIWLKYQLAWKIPIAIVLPLLGLLVNNGHLFNSSFIDGVFGDFSNIWFYILAVVNGILVCLPNLENKLYRLFLFIGRSLTFAYTLYFFLVFLPFLPLSIVAIIAFGTGFLMLTPLLLFVIHVNELSKDFAYLKPLFSKKLIIGMAVLGFLVIPSVITGTYLRDKSVLNKTLSYLYTPDFSKQYNINKKSLQKTLKLIKSHKNHNGSGGELFGNRIPYLSSYFNWLVMDNLTLSNSKIAEIEKVFFGKTSNNYMFREENIRNDNVNITNISTNSTYDKSQKAWKSWVDLEITNKNEDFWFSEYATTIDLPEGCWISDYYLYVGEVKESGILAEKKSAMWIFSQIRNENKDPGILYYLTGNRVSFRVFPFAKDEVRRTGIEFLHKEPIELNIDNNIIELGNIEETIYENIETENIAYVSAQQKQKLNQVARKPYFHFLVDVSKEQSDKSGDFIRRIEKVIGSYKPLSENAKISFVNSYVNTISLDADWRKQLDNQTFNGGFYLDRAIKIALFNAYQENSKSYPVIVVVTDSIENAVLGKDFADFRFAFPESDIFYHLDKNNNLRRHSLMRNSMVELPEIKRESIFHETVLEYRLSDNSIAYLPNNSEPSIILKRDIFDIADTEIKEKSWQSALTMQGQWISQTLHPEISEKEWNSMVKYSFISKIMTPVTSYLVVENEAQKAMLKKKQKEALSGNKSLDFSEDIDRMSEPSLILMGILLLLAVWYREKRKRAWTR
jgi:hypothetical protein